MDRKKRTLLMLVMLLVMAVIAVAGGFLLWNKQKAPEQTEVTQKLPTPDKEEDDSQKEQTYKILVKNAEGSPIQGILAAFYDKSGNIVGEPGTTNNMGAITLKTEEKNIVSAKVLAVPYEYELNKEFHEFKGSKKSISIVLNDNPNAYVTQIGDEVLLFKDAIAKANASETDVTIKLLGDVHYAQSFHLYNVNGKTITLDGQGHTLNLYTTSHSIKVYQNSGTINIQNMKIEHGGLGNLIVVGTTDKETALSSRVLNVNLSNLDIESESTHAYTLINTKRMQTINMNLSKVNLVWKTANEVKGGAIMPGVSGMDQVLNLTLKDSVIDVRQANGARGINAANKVTGEIKLINTKILTSNSAKPVSKGKMTLTRDTASYLNDGTPDEAKIGDAIYNKLAEAMEAANKSETDVTITLLNDTKMETHLLFENANGKNIVLDGAGHTLTVATKGHSMYVHQKTGTIDIVNMKIVHSGDGNVLRIGKKKNTEFSKDLVTVNLTNLDILSSSTHEYTLIHTNESQKIDLNMANVNLVWDTEREDIKGGAIMGSVSGLKQELNLAMRDCTVDVTKANGAKGIYAANAATGNINLYNTVIKTMKTEAVANNNMTLAIDTATSFNNGTADEVAIGTVKYNTLEEALLDANKATTDIKITMLCDVEIYEPIIVNNENVKNIIFDGVGHKMTALVNTHTFQVNQKAGAFSLSNMNIVHGGTGCVIRIGDRDETYTEKLIVNLDDLGIASESSCEFGLIQAGYGTMELDLNMANVDLAWKTDAEVQKGAIFAGLSGETTKLNLTMTDCNIDSSNTTGAYGISAESGVTGNLVLNDTNISSNKDSVVDKNMKFTRNTASELSTYPATQVQIGDVVYNELHEAAEDANTFTEDVTISILSDITIKNNVTIKNVNGKNVVVDGKGHKATVTAPILVYQKTGTVEIKDLNIKQTGNILFRFGDKNTSYTEKVTVNLNNIDIDSTSNQAKGLIQAGFGAMTLYLNMTDVNLTWAPTSTHAKGAITVGNADLGKETTVNLVMKDCNIDTSAADSCNGIYTESKAKGNLVLRSTSITSSTGQEAVLDGNLKYKRNTASVLSTYPATQYQVGDFIYNEFSEAITDVNAAKENVTLRLLSDVTITSNLTLQNTNGKNIVWDGNGHTVTMKKPILVYQEKGTVEFKDFKVTHTNDILFRIGDKNTSYTEKVTVNLNNIDIDSTSNQTKGLIQAGFGAMTLDLNMTGVKLVWKPSSTHAKGAITVGNADLTSATTVNLAMTDCELDTTGANEGQAVYAENNAIGTIQLISTDIKTAVDTPVNKNNMSLNIDKDTTFWKGTTQSVALVDGVHESDFANAITKVNSAEANTRIDMVADFSITANVTLKNTNGKNIVWAGNGHKATVKKPTLITQESGKIEVKELDITHTNDILFRIGNKNTDSAKSYGLEVNFENLNIDSVSNQKSAGLIQAGYATMTLSMNMKNVKVNWHDVKDITSAAIVAGYNGAQPTLNLTMTDCEVNVSGAIGAKAIQALDNVSGAINLNNTKLTTGEAVEVPVYYNQMALNIDKKSTFYKGTVQSVALVDGAHQSKFADAVTKVNAATANTRLDIVADGVSIIANTTIKNEKGKNVVLSGSGRTVTATAPVLITQESGKVDIKNLTVTHTNNILFRIGNKNKDPEKTYELEVNFDNVTINSTSNQTSNGLIQAAYGTMTLNLNMTNVKIDWDKAAGVTTGAIVGGYSGSKPTLNLTLKDCEIDASGSDGAKAIHVLDGVSGTIKLVGSTKNLMKADNETLIYNNQMTVSEQ